MANIEGLPVLPRLLGLLAARSAGLTNYAELSRTMGLPQTTLKRYLALLEATFLSHPVVLSPSPETTPFARNLHALPVDALWRFGAKA